MGELVLAKFAGQAVVNIAELILESVDSIGSIVRGMKENNRHASQLLEMVEAIEPPIRAIQKKGTTLSGSESLRQLLETVQEIRTVLDEYARTCIVARALKRKKIAKKFAWLGNNLTQKMHAVQLGDIADRLDDVPPAPAAAVPRAPTAGTSIGAPAKNVVDVLKQALTTVGQSTAVGAAAGGAGGALLALVGAETLTAAAIANAALAGAVCTGIGGVAVGVGIVAYQAMNCAQPSQTSS
ncbi:unnamed protein product [Ectocarpus sp. 8 AP-2014]